MQLTNNQIYLYANALIKEFNINAQQQLPIKVSFYLAKNKSLLLQLAQEIDQSRNNILEKYGTLSDDQTEYIISPENQEKCCLEINSLFSLTQDINLYKISLADFNNNDMLTLAQMEAIMFMIEEE